MADVLEKAIALYDEGLVDSYYEGIAVGEARGEARGEASKAAKIALKLLASNMTPESVAKFIDLSLDDVMKLKHNQ